MKRLERAAVADDRVHIVVVSERDAAGLGVDAAVIPNGTDPAPPTTWRPDQDVLFVGSLDYQPNALAVQWWEAEVAPWLPKGFPPLTVVGRGGNGLRSTSTVRFIGEVESVAPYLASASVVAIPLRHGGGTRLKLLEAMAWRRPVVTTPKGAEGLPVQPGTHVLVADSGREFAAAVCAARSDAGLAARLGSNSLELVKTFYWEPIGAAFAEHIDDVCRVEGCGG